MTYDNPPQQEEQTTQETNKLINELIWLRRLRLREVHTSETTGTCLKKGNKIENRSKGSLVGTQTYSVNE